MMSLKVEQKSHDFAFSLKFKNKFLKFILIYIKDSFKRIKETFVTDVSFTIFEFLRAD